MKLDRLSGYNPLRGLDLAGLVNFFERGEQGYYTDLMWLYRLILRRNGTGRAVRRKLGGAIGRLDWNIKIPEGLEGDRLALAEQQQAGLRKAFDAVANLREASVHLAFADIFGFAHCEKIYSRKGDDPWAVVELRVVPQWHMRRQGLWGNWEYDLQARDTNRGDAIEPRDWIWREVEDPAAEIIALAHLKMSTTDADWDQFCDTYAVPPLFLIQPPSVPPSKEQDYQDTAEAVVSDGRGTLPHGADVKTVSPGTGGESVFTERLRFYREEIVLAGTGGILTTLDGNTGIGKGPTESHDDTWLDIAAEICGDVGDKLQAGMGAPWLEKNFPGAEQLAYFEFDKPQRDRDPSSILADAKTAREAGYQIAMEDLAEKSGYKLTRDTQPASDDPSAPAAPPAKAEQANPEEQAAPGQQAGEGISAAIAGDLGIERRWLAPVEPVLSEVEALLADESVSIEAIQKKLEEAIGRIPELLGQMDIDALANALERDAAQGALAGLSAALRRKQSARRKTAP